MPSITPSTARMLCALQTYKITKAVFRVTYLSCPKAGKKARMDQLSCSDSTKETSTPKPATPNPTQEGNPFRLEGFKEKLEQKRRAEKGDTEGRKRETKGEEKGVAARADTDGARGMV